MFGLFAEDVGLLPANLFERFLKARKSDPDRLTTDLTELFGKMNTGSGFGVADIPWFDGSLFGPPADGAQPPSAGSDQLPPSPPGAGVPHENVAQQPSAGEFAGEDGLSPSPPRAGVPHSSPPRAGVPPGSHSAASVLHARISKAAKELNEQRERWLNPPEWIDPIAKAVDAEDDFTDVPEEARALIRHSAIMARAAKDVNLKKRTLTNLYNERPTWLKLAHEKLDRAVLAAYAAVDPDGEWSEDWADVWLETGAGQPLPDDHDLAERRREVDQLVLGNLLRMNLARAGRH